MEFGLSKEVMEKIKNIVRNNSNYEFYIFGSRARGDYKDTSDIDIAVFKEISNNDKYKIMNEFDSLDIIYKIDLVFISEDTKKELISSINKDAKKII